MSANYREIRAAVNLLNDREDALDKAQVAMGEAWTAFGQVLRKTREANKMSLRECAKKLGVSAPYLSDVELGRRMMTYDRVEQCLNLFRTSIETIRESILANAIKPTPGKIAAKRQRREEIPDDPKGPFASFP